LDEDFVSDVDITFPVDAELEDILNVLSPKQIEFVIRRQYAINDADAARDIGMSPGTIYNWKSAGVPIDRAIELMAHDGMRTALFLRRKALADAMLVKISGLKDDNHRIRQQVATELIEWQLGKAGQPLDLQMSADDRLMEFLSNVAKAGSGEMAD
jgi:hypothetical protein